MVACICKYVHYLPGRKKITDLLQLLIKLNYGSKVKVYVACLVSYRFNRGYWSEYASNWFFILCLPVSVISYLQRVLMRVCVKLILHLVSSCKCHLVSTEGHDESMRQIASWVFLFWKRQMNFWCMCSYFTPMCIVSSYWLYFCWCCFFWRGGTEPTIKLFQWKICKWSINALMRWA